MSLKQKIMPFRLLSMLCEPTPVNWAWWFKRALHKSCAGRKNSIPEKYGIPMWYHGYCSIFILKFALNRGLARFSKTQKALGRSILNIILNSYCNLTCNYCFADEYMEETVKHRVSPWNSIIFKMSSCRKSRILPSSILWRRTHPASPVQ